MIAHSRLSIAEPTRFGSESFTIETSLHTTIVKKSCPAPAGLLRLSRCLNPEPSALATFLHTTLYIAVHALDPAPHILNPKPLKLKPQIPNPKPKTPNPKPQTLNPKPQTLNPKHETLNLRH